MSGQYDVSLKQDGSLEWRPTFCCPQNRPFSCEKFHTWKNAPPIWEHWIKKFLLHFKLVHKQILDSNRLLKLMFHNKNLKGNLGLQWFFWNSNGYNWGVFKPILDSVNALPNITTKHSMQNVSSSRYVLQCLICSGTDESLINRHLTNKRSLSRFPVVTISGMQQSRWLFP